jgi:ferredoxin hydrogenase
MQGPTVKSYFAKKMDIKPEKIVHVAVTPCTAKKMEIRRKEMKAAGELHHSRNMRDTDYVITTRELAKWAKEEGIDYDEITPSGYDPLMGQASGGGVIFGNSGGVMEATVRCAYQLITGNTPPEKLYKLNEVRGYNNVRAATIDIDGKVIKVAVIYGTATAHKFIVDMAKSNSHYDFVEVMACPGGCIGGGGQPKNFDKDADEIRKARMTAIYDRDSQMDIKCCQQNPEIISLYDEFYGQAGSKLAEKMLHTTYAEEKHNLLP